MKSRWLRTVASCVLLLAPAPAAFAAVAGTGLPAHEVWFGLGGASSPEKDIFNVPNDLESKPELVLNLSYMHNLDAQKAFGIYLYGATETTPTVTVVDPGARKTRRSTCTPTTWAFATVTRSCAAASRLTRSSGRAGPSGRSRLPSPDPSNTRASAHVSDREPSTRSAGTSGSRPSCLARSDRPRGSRSPSATRPATSSTPGSWAARSISASRGGR